MLRFIWIRILQAIPVLFAVVTVTFFLVRFAPGGPFDQEKNTDPEILRALQTQYHLDDPLLVQYGSYLKELLHGDLGPSFKYPGRTVNELIAAGFPATAELGVYAFLIAILFGMAAGVVAALRPNTWRDYLPMSLAMTGISMPMLLLGPVLVLIFGIWLEWVPVSGWGDVPGDKILPSITLGAAYAAYFARLTRGGMLEVLSQDYIRTARAKGLPERIVILKHGLRAGVVPVVSYLGPALAGLLSGSFVVESVFQVPGLGRSFVQAAFNRDYTMILGTTTFMAVLIIVFNLLSDVLAAWLNPRLRSTLGGRK